MDEVQKINKLLDQAQGIEREASRIQGYENTTLEISQLEDIRERYEHWYAECLLLLPSDLKDKFQKQYEGDLVPSKIKQFLAYPREKHEAPKDTPGFLKMFLPHWKYPYQKTFREPFLEQQSLLRQARKRSVVNFSLIDERIKRTIAIVCKNSFQIQSIDKLFISNGCEARWWTQPKKESPSSRMDRAYGWFEAILLYVPEQEIQIMRGVIEDMLLSDRIAASDRKGLQVGLDQLIQRVQQRKQSLDRYNLHPRVTEIAAPLFADGHYRQALLDVYIELNNTVKLKSGRNDLDGTKLMQQVFSPNNPILRVSTDLDEQQGIMWLFSGAMMAIRNPKAHKVSTHPSPDETLEWLAFASALFKLSVIHLTFI